MTGRATNPRLILASSSPRRKKLLAEAGFEFDVVPPAISEPDYGPTQLSPRQQAESLAYFKARVVAEQYPQGRVLAADTIVAADGRVLGKAADRNEAAAMLATLSGTRHAVITAVVILGPGQTRLIASEISYVTMRKISKEQIEAYIELGEWSGKAGAYAIQETADKFIEKIEGSFTNVVGLPMELLDRMLAELKTHPQVHKKSQLNGAGAVQQGEK